MDRILRKLWNQYVGSNDIVDFQKYENECLRHGLCPCGFRFVDEMYNVCQYCEAKLILDDKQLQNCKHHGWLCPECRETTCEKCQDRCGNCKEKLCRSDSHVTSQLPATTYGHIEFCEECYQIFCSDCLSYCNNCDITCNGQIMCPSCLQNHLLSCFGPAEECSVCSVESDHLIDGMCEWCWADENGSPWGRCNMCSGARANNGSCACHPNT